MSPRGNGPQIREYPVAVVVFTTVTGRDARDAAHRAVGAVAAALGETPLPVPVRPGVPEGVARVVGINELAAAARNGEVTVVPTDLLRGGEGGRRG